SSSTPIKTSYHGHEHGGEGCCGGGGKGGCGCH
ncbi:hypothetical protein LTSEGIV_4646, partial [Salmonella enterica subsp. enterica serovar Give str. S5-487]